MEEKTSERAEGGSDSVYEVHFKRYKHKNIYDYKQIEKSPAKPILQTPGDYLSGEGSSAAICSNVSW